MAVCSFAARRCCGSRGRRPFLARCKQMMAYFFYSFQSVKIYQFKSEASYRLLTFQAPIVPIQQSSRFLAESVWAGEKVSKFETIHAIMSIKRRLLMQLAFDWSVKLSKLVKIFVVKPWIFNSVNVNRTLWCWGKQVLSVNAGKTNK